MAQLINEAKRMQFLAGLITESQLNEENITMDYYDKEKKANIPGTFNLIKIKFGNIDTGVPKEEDYSNDGTLPVFIGTDKPCERCSNNSIDKNKLTIGAYIDKEGNLVKKGGILNGMWLVDFDSSSNDATKSILSSIKDTSGLQKYIKDEYSKLKPAAQPQQESQLNEEKIPFFHLKQVLTPFGTDKPKADQMADLKVGLNVLPKKAYRDESDVKAALGKITKIEGDNVTIEKVNGEEANYKKSDLFHLIDGGYKFESLDIDAVVNEALAKVRKQSGKVKENFLGKIKDTLTGVTKGMNEEELALYDRFKKVQKKYPRNLDLNPKKEDGDAEILYYIKELAKQKDKNSKGYQNVKDNVEQQLKYYEK